MLPSEAEKVKGRSYWDVEPPAQMRITMHKNCPSIPTKIRFSLTSTAPLSITLKVISMAAADIHQPTY